MLCNRYDQKQGLKHSESKANLEDVIEKIMEQSSGNEFVMNGLSSLLKKSIEDSGAQGVRHTLRLPCVYHAFTLFTLRSLCCPFLLRFCSLSHGLSVSVLRNFSFYGSLFVFLVHLCVDIRGCRLIRSRATFFAAT